MTSIQLRVDFGHVLRDWDGFGVNYIETAQTQDYASFPQDRGGLSVLREEDRQFVVDLFFGPDGLQPGLLKMFQDPFQQAQPEPANHSDWPEPGAYDHTTTTQWMRYFAREGLARTARILADEADHLAAEAEVLLETIARLEGESVCLDRRALSSAPAAVARVAVRRALARAGGLARVGAVHVERLLSLARSPTAPGRRLPLPGRREVRYRQGELCIGPRSTVADRTELGRES